MFVPVQAMCFAPDDDEGQAGHGQAGDGLGGCAIGDDAPDVRLGQAQVRVGGDDRAAGGGATAVDGEGVGAGALACMSRSRSVGVSGP